MSAPRPDATRGLIDRYESVFRMVGRAMAAGPADPALSAGVAPLLLAEARLLDARLFEDWLALYAEEASLWIPAHPLDHPGRDQALAFDDRRRMAERARHMGDSQAWGTTAPAPLTARALGPVEAWRDEAGALATCSLTVTLVRRGPPLVLAGRQVLRLAPGGGRIGAKALLFPALALGQPAVGWLM